jgi:hypothetical protein
VRARGEPTSVEAGFDLEGQITPLRFTWRDASLRVEDIGRRWHEHGKRCFGVLAAGGRFFELRMDEASLCWRVSRVGKPRRAV